MLDPDRLNTLERFLSLGEAASSSASVTVVANLKEGDERSHVHDVQTEYLTQTELDEIITGFREAGYYSEAFTDEVEFIRWLIAEGWRNSKYQSHMIYSTAQRGFSPGRHALVPAAASFAGMTLLTSDPYSDCLSHHKFHAYSLLQAAGLSVPRTWMFDSRTGWANSCEPDNGLRVISKPNLESASVGVDNDSVFEFSAEETRRLSKLTDNLQQPILVQEFVSGWEVEVPVFSGDTALALDPIGISVGQGPQMGDRFLDHAAAYEGTYQFFDFSKSEPVLSEHLRKAAVRAVQVLGLAGIARIDFRMSSFGKAYIIDITGKPHLSRQSSVAARFEMLGLRYSDIFSAMVGLASSRG
jgi:D-alanine-D-alanine ligase